MARQKAQPASGADVPTQIKNEKLVRKRRQQIIDATVKLSIEHGYHNTTTRMIAKAAGFSIGSLYEYISSKEDLLYLVCSAIHEEVQKAVEDALSGEVCEKTQLATAIRRYFIVCDKMSDHVLLMYQVTQFLPDKWKKRVLDTELDISNTFIKALTQLSGKNDFPHLDEKACSLVGHNISVLGHMWAFRRWYLKKNFTIDQYISTQTDFILGLIY
ncbi:TetR/AcrR family transcriptional regulator [Desulfobacter curvatus]|uniref:TetR/AcrR family transcriptional regulator n=1 Tax=Desulfobacter curvatus TaxID=2290 RepID=UPI000371C26D|nr:TetR/AcrR family transcriptional regulator [Desulfobacter curvatus]